jgi:demethylmenaquinone methyltransferase/2-methoxy-6-polyprenyl-1,4-benzoquinol methylase
MYGLGDVDFFDRVAPLYDLVMPPADGAALAAGLDHATRPIDRLVDVGGGSGRAAASLVGPEITVADAAAGMLSRARRVRGLDGVAADAGRLPFRDGSVDAVTIVDALHHLPDREAALAEAARVLASGGALVVREFDPETLLGRALVAGEHVIGMGSRFYTPAALADAMDAVGLDPRIVDRGFGYTVVGVRR